jgi:hypothetical protein
MLLTLHTFLHSLYHPTNTLNTIQMIQFMTSIKLIHISASECHPQGVYYEKVIQVQHANLGTYHLYWYY